MVQLTEYEVERVLVENEYYFGDYITPTTQIIDVWERPSASNSVVRFRDTTSAIVFINQSFLRKYNFDFYNQTPFDSITVIDTISNTLKIRGYYYHFIGKLNNITNQGFIEIGDSIYIEQSVNTWLPINPTVDTAEMAFSLYILDTSLTEIYDFPCSAEYLDFADSIFHSYTYLATDELVTLAFTIFPNPAHSSLTIQLDKVASNEIILYTLSGKEVLRKTFDGQELTISMENWATGMYFLLIRNEFGEFMRKLTKE